MRDDEQEATPCEPRPGSRPVRQSVRVNVTLERDSECSHSIEATLPLSTFLWYHALELYSHNALAREGPTRYDGGRAGEEAG